MKLRKSSTFQVMMMFALIIGGIIATDLSDNSVSKKTAEYDFDYLRQLESPYYNSGEVIEYDSNNSVIHKKVVEGYSPGVDAGITETVQETNGVPTYRIVEEGRNEPIERSEPVTRSTTTVNNGQTFNVEPERTDGLTSRITTVTETGQVPNYYYSSTTSSTTTSSSSSSLPSTSGSNIRIFVDERAIRFTDAFPFIDENNRTLVPVRVVSENLGMTVTWDPTARRVGINNTMFLTIDSQYALVNGRTVVMDTKAIIVGGRTYVPLRFVSENFGVNVDWARNNLGGIDVFLNRQGSQQPGKIPVASDFVHIEASLPKTIETYLDGGHPVLKADFEEAFLRVPMESAVLIDNAIYYYLPKLPNGCMWGNHNSIVDFIGGGRMAGYETDMTQGGIVQKVDVSANALNRDWLRVYVALAFECEGTFTYAYSQYMKNFVDNFEWILISRGGRIVYEQYK